MNHGWALSLRLSGHRNSSSPLYGYYFYINLESPSPPEDHISAFRCHAPIQEAAFLGKHLQCRAMTTSQTGAPPTPRVLLSLRWNT